MLDIYTVNKPYYNAGKKFGWEGPSAGLGISIDKLEGTGTLMVKVKNKATIYTIDKVDAVALAEKYQAYTEFVVKSGRIKLAIIPWSQFKAIDDSSNSTSEQEG